MAKTLTAGKTAQKKKVNGTVNPLENIGETVTFPDTTQTQEQRDEAFIGRLDEITAEGLEVEAPNLSPALLDNREERETPERERGPWIHQRQIEITDNQAILGSKRYLKGGIEYPAAGEMLRGAIDALGNSGGRITLSGSHEASNANLDSTVNSSFGRLNLVARYEIDSEMFYEIGVLAAFDLQVPRVKVYRGPKVAACLNQCIFGAEDVVKFDLAGNNSTAQVIAFIEQQHEHMRKCIEIVQRLKALPIPAKTVSDIIGAMMLKTIEGKTMNGTTPILRASELFADTKSKYFYKQEGFNAWQLFNGFTEYFSEKVNFFDIPEKTRDTYHLLKDICLS